MTGRLFVDTNVLVYAVEASGEKPKTARRILRRPDVCISTHVLHEFYVAVTRPRRASPLSHDEALVWIQLWKKFEVHPLTVDHTDLALELAARFQLSFYDSLIIASCQFAGCPRLITEELSDRQDYGGVVAVNPFKA